MNHLVSDDSVRGIELAVTPVLFGAFGWLLDSWLGTGPWLAIALGTVAIAATIAKIWFGYDAEMREHEARGRWVRRSAEPGSDADASRDLWSERKAAS